MISSTLIVQCPLTPIKTFQHSFMQNLWAAIQKICNTPSINLFKFEILDTILYTNICISIGIVFDSFSGNLHGHRIHLN